MPRLSLHSGGCSCQLYSYPCSDSPAKATLIFHPTKFVDCMRAETLAAGTHPRSPLHGHVGQEKSQPAALTSLGCLGSGHKFRYLGVVMVL